MGNWVDRLISSVESRKSLESAIRARLPKVFESLIRVVEKDIEAVNQAIYNGSTGLTLSQTNQFGYKLARDTRDESSYIFFSFKTLELVIEDVQGNRTYFDPYLDEWDEVSFTERGRAGKTKATEISQLLIEPLVKHEFYLD